MKRKRLLLFVIIAWAIFCSTAFGRAFEVKVSGQGQDLILIPGLTCSGEVWNESVAILEDQYTCHVITIAGFAEVPPQQAIRDAFLETVLGDFESYIASLDGEVSIIGHSIGGFMGMALASRMPESVAKVVVVDSYPQLAGFMMGKNVDLEALRMQVKASRPMMLAIPDSAYAANQRQNMKASIDDPVRAEKVAQWGIESDRQTMLQAYEEVLLADIRSDLPLIQAEVLVLQSYNGLKLSKKEWKALNQRQFGQIEDVQIERTEEARHFIMYDAPAWYRQQLESFLL